jgi:hypothetical protein
MRGGEFKLPGVAQITTPVNESEPFNWNMDTPNIASLRAGPLSPAMLAGPRSSSGVDGISISSNTSNANSSLSQNPLLNHNLAFDPTFHLRTGLTPSTGLTPTGGNSSYPPKNGGSGSNGGEMTPGTFNGMMDQVSKIVQMGQGDQPNGNGQQQQQHSQHPLANSISAEPDYFSHRPSTAQTHVQQQQSMEQQQQPQQFPPLPASSYPPQQSFNSSSYAPNNSHPPYQPYQPAPPLLQQQQQPQQNDPYASQAANGLFLLSQAHNAIESGGGGMPMIPNGPQMQGLVRSNSKDRFHPSDDLNV